MEEPPDPLIQACPHCQVLIDVSDQEPLAVIFCPSCGGPSEVAGHIDHFNLLEVLGEGGMGVVYKALDTSLERLVALKLLRKSSTASPDQIAQLAHEAALTASINHPHVVKVYSTGMDAGRFYIAMELVQQGTLDQRITQDSKIPEAQALQIGIQIAQGLRAAHQAGLIHRDVKPGNILFDNLQIAKIVDFGLATTTEEGELSPSEIWGTPYYLAPEKLDHKPEDFRSDIYSLGATLFHALAGRPPFEDKTASLVAVKHLKTQAVSLQAFAPWISGATAFAINRTLKKDPEQRYQSYDELIEHLQYALSELSTPKPQISKRVVLETPAQNQVAFWFSILLILIFIGAASSIYFFRDSI
ncbi:MAG: serine/threonine-protein kinase, partial [Verrucomicrobia bacterium]|nr:serine/threonine-protein kinase [Verrucomicrobiota bacterium]